MTVEQHADELVKLSVVDLIALKKVLKDKYGLEIIPHAMAKTILAEEVVEAVEQKLFTVTLKKVSEASVEKMHTIRLIKDITGLGLKESKDLTDSAPVVLKENVSKAESEELTNKLNALNAEVIVT